MLVSYKWLQTYFDKKLPSSDELIERITFKAFEVEGVESKGDDTVIDIKVLPDRAHYALCHRGIAEEVSAITGLPYSKAPDTAYDVSNSVPGVDVFIDEDTSTSRYIARRINNIEIKESPKWLRERLVAVGARSINTIVDATNFVMLDMGQPLHAFDADKVQGSLQVRIARKGETIELLPEKVTENGNELFKERIIELSGFETVIVDDEGPIAIAGVKGGNRAAVTEGTRNIILEAAHFDPVRVRKAAGVHNLRNDSSKRFENEITPEWAVIGMNEVTGLILSLSPGAEAGIVTDIYPRTPITRVIEVAPDKIAMSLGASVTKEEIVSILSRMKIGVEDKGELLRLTIPHHRLDLEGSHDIVEEVGRIYGYEKVNPVLPSSSSKPPVHKQFYYAEKIKDILVKEGYSELYLYSLVSDGDVKIANPLAADKNSLRESLVPGIESALEKNSRQADLLDSDVIKVFEIGHVFTKNGERNMLGIGVYAKKTKTRNEEVARVLAIIKEQIGLNVVVERDVNVVEVDLTDVVQNLPEPAADDIYIPTDVGTYRPLSPYPYIVRDIAMFVPEGTETDEVQNLVTSKAGEMAIRTVLFDVFTKQFEDGAKKTSYAFRIVFQSHERTLSDEEANAVMDGVYRAVQDKGWEVR